MEAGSLGKVRIAHVGWGLAEEQAAFLGFCRENLAQHRKLVQDHKAGLRTSCGETAMQGNNKALRNDTLAKTPNCLQMPVV